MPGYTLPTRRRLVRPAATLLTLALLTGCGAAGGGTEMPGGPTTSADAPSSSTAADALTIDDGWVKASDTDMTAAFGTLVNHTDMPMKVVGATTPAAKDVETHVMEPDASGQMQMVEAKDGFTIPANGRFPLAPGAEHLMLMDLTKPLKTGEDVTLTVRDGDGREHPLRLVVRAFPGAQEDYEPEDKDDKKGTEKDDKDDEGKKSSSGDQHGEHAEHTDGAEHSDHSGQ